MIDNSNPKQMEWLKLVNAEVGNQLTSNAALIVENEFLRKDIENLKKALEDSLKHNADMGLSNANLHEENRLLKSSRGKKRE